MTANTTIHSEIAALRAEGVTDILVSVSNPNAFGQHWGEETALSAEDMEQAMTDIGDGFSTAGMMSAEEYEAAYPLPVPEVVTGYYVQGITGATGGFGMYQAEANSGDDLYTDLSDLMAASELRHSVSTDDSGWEDDENTELVAMINDVLGQCYNEPEIIVAAIHYGQEEPIIFGINSVDCYEKDHGELVTVAAYNNDPSRYILV